MAEGVVSFLLVKLAEYISSERQELAAVRDEAEYICEELQFMKAFLGVADAIEDSDHVLKLLVKKVRDVAYDTEDALDDFMLRLTHDQGGHGLFSCMKKFSRLVKNVRARRKIASKIQNIKSRITSISEQHRRYCNKNNLTLLQPPTTPTSGGGLTLKERQGDASLPEEADPVGIDKPKRQLIGWLLRTRFEREVISVTGMGGLGKTTLVKKVYEDPEVKQHFKFRVWVTVSQSFRIEDLMKDMIHQLYQVLRKPEPQDVDMMGYDKLRTILTKFLEHRKYLIVLDDVWNSKAWDAFQCALPNNLHGSRVLLTTRKQDVAAACCLEFPDNVYALRPLSSDESRTLFCKKVFQKKSCPRHLRKVSDRILHRCEGLPLAIVAISGVLATKESRIDEWEMVHRSLGVEFEFNDKLKNILSLSYNELPSHLKSCLLYFSIFPVGNPIERMRLIRLWIAEGFVEEQDGKTLEEVAGGYLNELTNRNLVQVVESTTDGRVKTYRIHDLLLESIIQKSREYDFVAIAKEPSMVPEYVRRISIHDAAQHGHISISTRLRSLVMFWRVDSVSESSNFGLSCGGYRLLNVLDLQGAPIKEFPRDIVNLYLLKYLSLRSTKVNSVPDSIGNLQYLETLDLKQTHVTKLPATILNLQKLGHLLVYRYQVEHDSPISIKFGFQAPQSIGLMQSIRKLCFVDANQRSQLMVELGKLHQLRRLGIVNLKEEDGKALCSSIEKLKNLHALSVTSRTRNEIIDMQHLSSPPPSLYRLYLTGRLEKLPKWLPSLHCLVKLVLKWTGLHDDPLIGIQNLPNLVHLEFVQVYDGNTLRFKRGGFRRLKVLGLNKLDGLGTIIVQKGAMPCLQKLIIQCCKLLKKVPSGIKYLNELKSLELFDMPIDFLKRLHPEGGEDYPDVKNVPEVYGTYQINGCFDVFSFGFGEKKIYAGPPNTSFKEREHPWKA